MVKSIDESMINIIGYKGLNTLLLLILMN